MRAPTVSAWRSTVLLGVVMAVSVSLSTAASAQEPPATERISGDDRVETAVALSEASHTQADRAVLVRAHDFPDALTATSLAGLVDGPVLLARRDALPEATRAELQRLRAREVLLVGGEAAVGPEVEEALAAEGHEVTRLAGADRYATSAAVVSHIGERAGELAGRRTVLVASGEDFADATTAGPAAFGQVLPMALTRPGSLPAPVARAIGELALDHAVVLGGREAVSEQVVDELSALGLSVRRVGGVDRTATATAFASFQEEELGYGPPTVLVARGDDYADTLAAAPHAAGISSPILLTRTPSEVTRSTLRYLVDRAESVGRVLAVGGGSAVSDVALEGLAAAATPPQRTYTYEVGASGEVTSDLEDFARMVSWTLVDPNGWSLGHDLRFREVTSGGDLRLWLAAPSQVAAADPVCSSRWSCRVGDDVLINDRRWAEATATYASRPLAEYRHYVVNHEVGHWLGHGHRGCPEAGTRAPVMQQQSIALEGCAPNVWPLESELRQVREWHLGGSEAGRRTAPEAVED